MPHPSQPPVRPSILAYILSLSIGLLVHTAWAGDKSAGSTPDYLLNEACHGVCSDGYYAHRVKVIKDRNNTCGPIAAAAILADLGCETLKGSWRGTADLPRWGTSPRRMAKMINNHIAKGDGCYPVIYGPRTFANARQYLDSLETLTRDKGYPVAALIKPGSAEKYWLHWVVVGDVGPTDDYSCVVTYYDNGHRRQVLCSEFTLWASRRIRRTLRERLHHRRSHEKPHLNRTLRPPGRGDATRARADFPHDTSPTPPTRPRTARHGCPCGRACLDGLADRLRYRAGSRGR